MNPGHSQALEYAASLEQAEAVDGIKCDDDDSEHVVEVVAGSTVVGV